MNSDVGYGISDFGLQIVDYFYSFAFLILH